MITAYEDEHYPIPEGTPLNTFKHLMDAQDLKQADLIGVIGSRGMVSDVINGKRDLSKAQAKTLAAYFGVAVGLFI